MDAITLAAAKKFAKDTAMRMGAVKGAAAQIQSVEEITGGHKVIFKWEDNAGGVHTESIDVMDGVTPLVYKKCPNIATSDLAAGDSFSAPKSDFNREPLDGDEFFTYLTATSAEGVVLLYATVCRWRKDDESALVRNFEKIATTGLKALTAVKAIERDLTQDGAFDLPLATFNRAPDGTAEECLVFDRFGHYRTCSVAMKSADTVTVTPTTAVVNINIGSVRYDHEQNAAAKKWTVQHNLNILCPTVYCTDYDKALIVGEVVFKTMNLLEINFCEPVSGIAHISK